ncbi:hypothetical protein HYU13_05500 [Candidatus Woesearchaeota archaeon]|nr:hypothetical protein [Candidatus Woesearchaeota archaeon]
MARIINGKFGNKEENISGIKPDELVLRIEQCLQWVSELDRYISFKESFAKRLSLVMGYYGKSFVLDDKANTKIPFSSIRNRFDLMGNIVRYQQAIVRELSEVAAFISAQNTTGPEKKVLEAFKHSRAFVAPSEPKKYLFLPSFKMKEEEFYRNITGLMIGQILQLQARALSEISYDSVKKLAPLIQRENEIWRETLAACGGVPQIQASLTRYRAFLQSGIGERLRRLASANVDSFTRLAAGLILSARILLGGITAEAQEAPAAKPIEEQAKTETLTTKNSLLWPEMKPWGQQSSVPARIWYGAEKRYIFPFELFKILNEGSDNMPVKATEFYPARQPSAPLLIILEDIHATKKPNKPEQSQELSDPIALYNRLIGEQENADKDLEKIEFLRMKFGISFIGFEGWAGHEADAKRGFQIFNAQDDLIPRFLSQPIGEQFTVVPLEDPELQEMVLKAVVGHLSLMARESSLKIAIYKSRELFLNQFQPSKTTAIINVGLKNSIDRMSGWTGYAASNIYSFLSKLRLAHEGLKDDAAKNLEIAEEVLSQCYRWANREMQKGGEPFETSPYNTSLLGDDLKEIEIKVGEEKESLKRFFSVLRYRQGISPEEFEKKIEGQWGIERELWKKKYEASFGKNRFKKFFDELAINRRNHAGAGLMAASMHGKSEAGIMFFGRGHTPGLITELKKIGDFHIIVAK